ncbi:MAG: heme exporter protein CcmB [Dehalococcoidia bacterium]|nr:heme exporter protein CcmB [Dehalococcoidia bacterium]
MKDYLAGVTTILWKDVLTELRTKDILLSVFIFALLSLVIFSFALRADRATVAGIAPGVLWAAFSFSGILALNRAFATEREKGSLEGLVITPVSRDAIYFGKMLGVLIFMLAAEIVLLPVFVVLFNVPLDLPRLLPIIFLATLGFASVGTVFSAIAVNTRSREIMLPVLFLPVVVPVVISAVEASARVMAGEPWSNVSVWLQVLVAFDVIFVVVSSLVFEYVLEE